MNKVLIIFAFFLISLGSNAQDQWEFSNSTPQEMVKSHFYFLDKAHYNVELATYTLGDVNMSAKKKKSSIIKLKNILVELHLNIDEVLDRRKGIVEKDKYQIFPNETLIYLIRDNRTWVYAPETIENIPNLYKKYILNIKHIENEKREDQTHFIEKLVQSDSSLSKFTLGTPANTIGSHLIYLSDSLFNPKMASKTVNFAPEDTAQAEELAIMLKQIFLGLDRKVFDFENISKDSNYIDSTTNKAIYFPNSNYQKLYLEKIGNNWYYSRSTSKVIRSAHEEMYGSDAGEVFRFSDRFKRWAGVRSNLLIGKVLKLWQLYMFIYFLSIYLLLYLINRFIVKLIFKKVFGGSRYCKASFRIFTTLTYIILFYIIRNYAPSFELSLDYNHEILKIIRLFIIFYNTLLANYIVNFLKIFFTKGHSYDSKYGIVNFISLIIKTIIFLSSMLFVIDTLDFNVVNFLAGLSIGGFALALGAQDTVKNFLGSLLIFADNSFQVGDWITNNEVSGTVEEIGLRSTKIRTFYNSVVTVPNSHLTDNEIDNMGKRRYRRYRTSVVVKYDTPSDKIQEFTLRINKIIEEHSSTRKDLYMVYMHDFTKLGVEVQIYTFFEVPNWNMELKARHDLIKSILDLKDELKVEFSIPNVFFDD